MVLGLRCIDCVTSIARKGGTGKRKVQDFIFHMYFSNSWSLQWNAGVPSDIFGSGHWPHILKCVASEVYIWIGSANFSWNVPQFNSNFEHFG